MWSRSNLEVWKNLSGASHCTRRAEHKPPTGDCLSSLSGSIRQLLKGAIILLGAAAYVGRRELARE
jgi:hypothetical protein